MQSERDHFAIVVRVTPKPPPASIPIKTWQFAYLAPTAGLYEVLDIGDEPKRLAFMRSRVVRSEMVAVGRAPRLSSGLALDRLIDDIETRKAVRNDRQEAHPSEGSTSLARPRRPFVEPMAR